jgi:asparagine synthetase B (glutamine-hydrolysing)
MQAHIRINSFAFVYYQKATQRVFFARDPLGRRSLLVHFPSIEEPFLLLTSASNTSCPLYALEELSTEFLFIFNLNKSGQHSVSSLNLTH